jgi:hypothetical protein
MNVAAQPIGTAPSRLDAFRPAQRLAAIGVSEILAVTAQAAALKQQGQAGYHSGHRRARF